MTDSDGDDEKQWEDNSVCIVKTDVLLVKINPPKFSQITF